MSPRLVVREAEALGKGAMLLDCACPFCRRVSEICTSALVGLLLGSSVNLSLVPGPQEVEVGANPLGSHTD